MFCSNCGSAVNPETRLCTQCRVPGATPPPTPPGSTVGAADSGTPDLRNFNAQDFFNFRLMITPIIMKWYFIIVGGFIALGILIGFIVTVANGSVGFALLTLILGALGLVVFRVICEVMVVLFAMLRELVKLNRE